MQLCKKRKTFCNLFIAFLESILNFGHFKKKKEKKKSLIAYVHNFYYKNQYILYEPHDS